MKIKKAAIKMIVIKYRISFIVLTEAIASPGVFRYNIGV